uniref:SOCS6 suppressor of cytokine signaling n=1 Tax=Phallusia mammillata TaxID=59560 RepID=A0A6F9DTK3_9ASCI|nr:SOCS6 suppressor of cytokine signaling [Phallusia mammillata]
MYQVITLIEPVCSEIEVQSPKKQGKSFFRMFSREKVRTSVDENTTEDVKSPVSNGLKPTTGDVLDTGSFTSCPSTPTSATTQSIDEKDEKRQNNSTEDDCKDLPNGHPDHANDVTQSPSASSIERLQENDGLASVDNEEQEVSNEFVPRGRMPSPTPKSRIVFSNGNEFRTLTEELRNLAKQGWYWGPLTKNEAETKLNDCPDGSFLVRDSSDERYLLSVSFRSDGRTLHTRIQYSHGFSFYENFDYSSTSVVKLINDSVKESQDSNVFCYSRSRDRFASVTSVKLAYPVSRLSEVRSLQYLCRFVIRQYTRIDHIEILPLPNMVKGYLNQSYF